MSRPLAACRCVRCGRAMRPQRTAADWFHKGRGLCDSCYGGAYRRGELDRYERRTYSREDLMSDWAVLRAEGYSKRQAAERIGVTLAAFDRAFHRARNAGDPRALPALNNVCAHVRRAPPPWFEKRSA